MQSCHPSGSRLSLVVEQHSSGFCDDHVFEESADIPNGHLLCPHDACG